MLKINTVTVATANGIAHVRLPEPLDINSVRAHIKTWKSSINNILVSSLDCYDVASHLIYLFRYHGHKARFVPTVGDNEYKSNHQLIISYHYSNAYNNGIKITVVKDNNFKFVGTWVQFDSWTPDTKNWDKFIGKVIRFNYKKGSSSGPRVIKLDKIENAAGTDPLLKGKDLVKDAFRSYHTSGIQGEVELLS